MMVCEMKVVSSILKTTIHCILTEYPMNKKAVVWWVPHMLFPSQKQHRREPCQKHLTRYK